MRKNLLILNIGLAAAFPPAFGDEIKSKTPPKSVCEKQVHHETSPLKIVGLGAMMAIPAYFLGVVWHEGSHGLYAEALGGDVTEMSFLPSHAKSDGRLIFGYTRYVTNRNCVAADAPPGILVIDDDCPFGRNERVHFHLMPKYVDLGLMTAAVAANQAGYMPRNVYARTALTTLAVAAWIDFSKDALSTSKYNDLNKVYRLLGEDHHDKLNPYALIYYGLIGASGLGVGKTVYDLFTDPDHKKKRARFGTRLHVSPGMLGIHGVF